MSNEKSSKLHVLSFTYNNGPGDRTRTCTLGALDPKSNVSANFTTPGCPTILSYFLHFATINVKSLEHKSFQFHPVNRFLIFQSILL